MGIDNVVNDPGMTYALFGGINYRITPRFSLGLGVGIYKTEFVAAYLHLNFNLRREHSTKDNYPYIGIQAGGVYSTWIGENFGDERGFMMEPRLGWSFYSKKGQLRYNVFAGANLFSFSLTPKIGIAFEL
ncbi:hypothetical protein BN938_0817 [Mucinivorans hirudinis]|uniref:Outer membrane protein beta-barrel domain-containing protein n=1 Tax=Mucinivorans hirudinis TaxID=1433126 RepID=A0A060RAX2_9BACT|nr:hypothetical protein BN938_0817 [Mucinivorans hirudinis]